MLHTILIVFAFVLAICATFNVPAPPRVNLLAAAAAFYLAALLVPLVSR